VQKWKFYGKKLGFTKRRELVWLFHALACKIAFDASVKIFKLRSCKTIWVYWVAQGCSDTFAGAGDLLGTKSGNFIDTGALLGIFRYICRQRPAFTGRGGGAPYVPAALHHWRYVSDNEFFTKFSRFFVLLCFWRTNACCTARVLKSHLKKYNAQRDTKLSKTHKANEEK